MTDANAALTHGNAERNVEDTSGASPPIDADLSAPDAPESASPLVDGSSSRASTAARKAVSKEATGRKASTKKASTKKASPKKASAKKASAKKAVRGPRMSAQPKYPRHSVERALRIPLALYEQNAGNPATVQEAAHFTGTGVSGNFNVEVSSAKKYGFLGTDEKKQLVLTDRARRAVAPQTETDRVNALREAILAAPDISTVYNYYRGESLPDAQFFINAMTDRFGIPAEKVAEFHEIFNESVRAAELVDDSGDRIRLIDIGRDEAHRSPATSGTPAPRALARTDATCFVMQPFAPPLGGYYDSVYKPAIEQAGLHPVRADESIFATGKIMDQIWRGIRSARVLVAELTSKNPNVFYELGLAHALEKPVVLVSSNEDDVPFDLRHIRIILYDQADPFWGEKLINKIADNIRSAL